MRGPILSSIITVHSEGLKAHKAMTSVFNALRKLDDNGYSYEIIVHIDNGDEITKKYFTRYEKHKSIRIFHNYFGDPGPSRNFAAKQAKGKYISFLDGDDLISDNWFIESVKLLEQKPDSIIHPEAVLTFGINQPNVLTLYSGSLDRETDRCILLGENRWGSVITLSKDIFLDNQYQKLTNGYSHEDYVFSIETVNKGIVHQVAKKTILFYRRSDQSRLSSSNQDHLIIPYSDFFDFLKFPKDHQSEVKPVSKFVSLRSKGYKLYKKIRNNDFLNFFITPPAKLVLRIINGRQSIEGVKKIPNFVIDEWTKINQIETQLYPYRNVVNSIQFYQAEDQVAVGNAFAKIAQHVNHYPDYVFIVPWIVRGGSDKVLLNTIKALREIHPDWNITVISTLPVKSTWAKDLPNYVDYLDFGNLASGLTPLAQDSLFSRIITQLRCDKLHIINSEYGFRWAMSHKKLLEHRYTLNVSLFASEFIPGSKMLARYSYDDPFIFELYDVINKIFTDNENIISESITKNGFDRSKFKIHYQPIDFKMFPEKTPVKHQKFCLLWAGRVVNVKLPDIVRQIGDKLDPNKFQIDVYGELSRDVKKDIFSNTESIKYCGIFDGFHTLPTEKYDAFLYTCLSDGMPNAILEAAASRLPIIASNDGGVGEFVVNQKTGVLVDDPLDVDSYVRQIKRASRDRETLKKYRDNAYKLLQSRHSWDRFINVIKEDL